MAAAAAAAVLAAARAAPPGGWSTVRDRALTCSSAEYKGELGCGGPCSAAGLCLAAAESNAVGANYAVWRGDTDQGCYICDCSDRGDPSVWAWSAQAGAVSFVAAAAAPTPPPAPLVPVAVDVAVDARAAGTPFVHRWKRSFGSGHASLTLRDDWRAQLTQAVTDLGLGGVRYHGLFDDDMGPVVTLDGGKFVYNWTLVDSTWDFLVAHKVRPIVELSFMPAYIANCSWHGHCKQDAVNCTGYWCTQCNGDGVLPEPVNPTAPKCSRLEFHYQGIKQTPPGGDYSGWSALVAAVAEHAIGRYGADEVRGWSFEVWNELWGMAFPDDYMALYAASVTALKSVDPKLLVGGPATAGLAYMPQFVNETRSRGLPPPDFVSSHHYPTDGKNGPDSPDGCPRGSDWDPACFARQVLAARESVAPLPFYLTEYNVGCCLGYASHDTAAAAAFVFRTVGDLNDAGVDVYSYWTFSDVFEEGGLPRVEFKNVYGAMTVGGVPKPVWRAFEALHAHAGDARLPARVGAQDLPVLSAFATAAAAEGVRVFLSHWSNPEAAPGAEADRVARVVVRHCGGPGCGFAAAALHVITAAPGGCDPAAAWRAMGSPARPTAAQLTELRNASRATVLSVALREVNATATEVNCTLPANTAAVLVLGGAAR